MWRSLVARLTGGQKVVGSNPVIPTMYTFITILSILSAVLILCIVLTFRSDKPIVTSTRRLMISAFFPIAANMTVVISRNMEISGFAYLLYFASTNWMLAYAIRFVTEYCGLKYRGTGWERLVGFLCGVDTVIMMFNPWFHHVFTVDSVSLGDGQIYYKYYSAWYHIYHLGFSYMLTAICIGILVYKIAKTSALYREKYTVILFSALVVAVWELYYLVNRSVLEYSMISYALFPILIWFFALVYKPYFATYRMFSEVLTNISEAIFFYDPDNVCIYTNRRAKELLDYVGKSADEAWDYAIEILADGDKFTMQDIMGEGFFQCVRDYQAAGETFTYDLELQRIYDKRERPVGAFITARDRTEEQRRINKERYQATHDTLTGLYNAEYLYSRMEKLLIEYPDRRYVVVASDIKGFKMVNDIYGRKTGDDILISIARQIKEKAEEPTIYGRIAGDKFGLIMPRERFTEDLFTESVKSIATDMDRDMIYPIVIHVGVYEVTDRRIPPSVMFDRAYMALATIKNDMQKRVAYYDANLREDILWEQRIAGSIDLGLEEEQILPYVQPQVTKDGTIQGVEMLARWMHPTEGFLKPRRFLPTLEKNGYIVRLDQFMWNKACQTIKRWEEMGWDDLYITVNISPVDFFFIDVVEEFKMLIEKYDLDTDKLRLEITEKTMIYDSKRRIAAIDQLRDLGFIVEMDDFGNGYSSLNMLKDIPIDVMKIDMTFLEETRDENRANQILETIISLAKRLEIPVITEGVETKEQVQMLSEMGCEMFQGYYYARAVPVTEFEDRYIRSGGGRIIREV